MTLIPCVKTMPADAATSSKMSQSPFSMQNWGPDSALIDTLGQEWPGKRSMAYWRRNFDLADVSSLAMATRTSLLIKNLQTRFSH
jgi:hypothetical protein